MHTKKSHGISKHIRTIILHSVDKNESKITEAFQTMGHYGVILLAFLFVIAIFLWKEGKLKTSTQSTNNLPSIKPTEALKVVPRADVGMRMIFDQANGEMSTDEARLASGSALQTPQDFEENSTQQSRDIPVINLQGPWQCSVKVPEGSAELHILNKNVRFISTSAGTTDNTLLNDGCIYTWQGNTGTRQCGLDQYMDMFSSLLSDSEGIDLGSILAEQVGSDPGQSEAYILLLQSCQKIPSNSSLFVVPQNVTWDESSSTDLDMMNLLQ